jgi:hypothetical protein
VGNGSIGGKKPTSESRRSSVEHLADGGGLPDLRMDPHNPLKREVLRKCGAMSEQSADSGRGNEQVPQKLVQLVGYRDPSAQSDPWVRPRFVPVKR